MSNDSSFNITPPIKERGFPGGSVVKNPPTNAGAVDSVIGSARSLRGGNATHSSILAWEIL